MNEEVTRADGSKVNVVATSKEDFKAAKAQAAKDSAPVYPNINHPVQKGHDQVAVGSDVSKVLVDGTGAHNSPYNAVDDQGNETGDKNVTAAGMEEPAYKSVPVGNSTDRDPRFATDAEVASAKKDAEPANEVEPKGAVDKNEEKNNDKK